jgi:predicted HTH transcriptional regulator
MTGWLEYFIIGLSTQLTEVKKRGELAIRRDVLARKYDLSERQSMALAHLLEQGKITIQDYESLCPKISRRTLQRDLKYMLEKNVIREKGGGGATAHPALRFGQTVTSCDIEL